MEVRRGGVTTFIAKTGDVDHQHATAKSKGVMAKRKTRSHVRTCRLSMVSYQWERDRLYCCTCSKYDCYCCCPLLLYTSSLCKRVCLSFYDHIVYIRVCVCVKASSTVSCVCRRPIYFGPHCTCAWYNVGRRPNRGDTTVRTKSTEEFIFLHYFHLRCFPSSIAPIECWSRDHESLSMLAHAWYEKRSQIVWLDQDNNSSVVSVRRSRLINQTTSYSTCFWDGLFLKTSDTTTKYKEREFPPQSCKLFVHTRVVFSVRKGRAMHHQRIERRLAAREKFSLLDKSERETAAVISIQRVSHQQPTTYSRI